jgi:predicted ATP-grasp superfamily ATP-dependent carboligase
MPITAFVTDGNQRPALSIVRALGRRGITVIVGEDRKASLAGSSRYCARQLTYPSPYDDSDAFDRFLRSFVAREQIDVVMPVTDVTTHAVCRNQERLKNHCMLAVPPFEAFDLVTNKARLLEYAGRCGVPVPRTHVVEGRARLSDVIDRVRYPAVVKPVQSRTRTPQGWLLGSAHYAHSRPELEQLFDKHVYLGSHPSLIQERIVGPGVGMFALFDRGRLVAEFSHQRLREKPPAGGASVLSQSLPVDPRLREFAVRMLGPIGWHGVAMMEYKQDRRTGELVLMEVNGRFWGSLELAVDAGVDFPHLAFQLARGIRPEAPPEYQVGVKNRWLLGDLDHLVLRLFRSADALDLPDGAPSTARALLDFVKVVEPKLHYEVISGTDWRPFTCELRHYVRDLAMSVLPFRRPRPVKPALPALAVSETTARIAACPELSRGVEP